MVTRAGGGEGGRQAPLGELCGRQPFHQEALRERFDLVARRPLPLNPRQEFLVVSECSGAIAEVEAERVRQDRKKSCRKFLSVVFRSPPARPPVPAPCNFAPASPVPNKSSSLPTRSLISCAAMKACGGTKPWGVSWRSSMIATPWCSAIGRLPGARAKAARPSQLPSGRPRRRAYVMHLGLPRDCECPACRVCALHPTKKVTFLTTPIYLCDVCGRRFRPRNGVWWSMLCGLLIGVGGSAGALLLIHQIGDRFSVIEVFALAASLLLPAALILGRANVSAYSWNEFEP